jgi:hypothetical protein
MTLSARSMRLASIRNRAWYFAGCVGVVVTPRPPDEGPDSPYTHIGRQRRFRRRWRRRRGRRHRRRRRPGRQQRHRWRRRQGRHRWRRRQGRHRRWRRPTRLIEADRPHPALGGCGSTVAVRIAAHATRAGLRTRCARVLAARQSRRITYVPSSSRSISRSHVFSHTGVSVREPMKALRIAPPG